MNVIESLKEQPSPEVSFSLYCEWYVVAVKGYILAWAEHPGGDLHHPVRGPADTRKLDDSLRAYARRDAERKRSCVLCIMHRRHPVHKRRCWRREVVRLDPTGAKLELVRQSVYVIMEMNTAAREAFGVRMARLATEITGMPHRFYRDVTKSYLEFLGDYLPVHEAVKTWQMGRSLLVSDIIRRPELLREIFRWNHVLSAKDFLSPTSSPAMVEEEIEDVNRDMISAAECSYWSEDGVLYCLTSDEECGNRMRVNP